MRPVSQLCRPHPQKAAPLGVDGSVGAAGMGVLKNGRRRWGQTAAKTSDSWEESDPAETTASNSKKPSLGNAKEEEEASLKEHRPQ